ncbi:AI-2E family transporter [Clostridium rectalis]|uniref:AI-2E family transporter n=1 Tax=Clostridium rectalis TaxID=2040295 RepID=UPI000F62F68C|nr:AI-2E family transporter [Clostridium rectalis]
MNFFKSLYEKEFIKKLLMFIFLLLIFFLLKDFFNLILLTFLFTYLVYSLQNFIIKNVSSFYNINEKLITIILYIILLMIFLLFIFKYVPIIINQCIDIINQLSEFKLDSIDFRLQKYLTPIINQINMHGTLKESTNFLIKFAANIGKWGFDIIVAFILSIFFMLEKKDISLFLKRFEHSKINGLYTYAKYFGVNFLNSFGKVIQAQILIAITNTILSIITLSIMKFPQLLGLGLMIFLLSLIPVAGTIISLIPLSIIAFNIGGFSKVIYIIIMIILLHSLESYVLNPKFMSAKTNLPVFIVFLILIVSEHFMGVWGLLIGIPLFIFILDILNVDNE